MSEEKTKTQLTRYEAESRNDLGFNKEYFFVEKVSTALSTDYVTFGYKDSKGNWVKI